mmetsp:Transcript_53162/g.57699  ORF Transcript_53162/g.57699 Transcript_53162/m.57699 type:complete len:353 (+) Transcript_53162:180-1238(+)
MSVWVHLVIEGEEHEGEPFKISPIPDDINDLKKAVKTELETTLRHCDAANLSVYSPGTGVPIQDSESRLKANMVCSDILGVTYESPLIVVAPASKQVDKVALPEVQMTSEQQVQMQVQQLTLLKLVAEEVNKHRKSRLNCWERESARTTGSKRSPSFRKDVIKYYQRENPSRNCVKCQILDEYVTHAAAENTIIAAHIWKASTRGKDLDEFGLSDNDVNSARNGLFLTKGIEDAFDNLQVCFLYNKLTTQLFLWVADTKIRKHKIIGSDPRKKFSDVHQKPLCCPNQDAMPFRRILSWHARLTLELRKENVPVSDYTSEYDHSPTRRGAQQDPIAQAIDEMVDPGDDASVSR